MDSHQTLKDLDLIPFLKLVTDGLDKAEIPYMLTGGLAVSYWGLPRTTHDIDIVIEAKKEDKEKIVALFEKDFYISPEIKAKERTVVLQKSGDDDSNNWIRINPRQFQCSLGKCTEIEGNIIGTYSKNLEVLNVFEKIVTSLKVIQK